MINSIFIISASGEVVIEKHYRGLMTRSVCDKFWNEVNSVKDAKDVKPIIATSKWYLIHIQHKGLFFLAVVQHETPPLLVLEFLQQVLTVFGQYMSDITEDAIRDKFVIVYQLLDEMMDDGFPFTTYPNVLTEMINNSNLWKDFMDNIPIPGTLPGIGDRIGAITTPTGHKSQLPLSASSNIPWRAASVKYATNEIYLDIIEEIDCIIGRNGRTVQCEVFGTVLCNSRLSGTPDLALSFQNARLLDNLSFHPCVRFRQWDNSRVVSFVPPDGKFKLMEFTMTGKTQGLDVPMYVNPNISWGPGGGRVSITAGTKGLVSNTVENVVITIPFSKKVSSTNLTADWGQVSYDEIGKVCVWKMSKLPRDKSPTLSGNVSLPPGDPIPDARPIISVQFKVTQFSASGLRVDSLQVNAVSYKPYKGVRSITKAGQFEIRT
eukprot:TRINITY_DN11445_c0_g1_i1.p1 TRINITY_DN11445_c0_g1~~TRINITY_DN11445_c0_g1_i1.p1  ORF type:complete len:434 (-),score=48.20 TRINITY_DN11445_c0_g1_i1:31-1332(-)